MASLEDIYQQVVTPKEGAPPPKRSLQEIYSDVVGKEEGKRTLSGIMGREEGVDYSKGADIMTRYNVMRATNVQEEAKFLQNRYGAGNFKQDKGGNWLVKQQGSWVPVYPAGVLESLKTGGAAVAAQAPELGGAIGGALAGEAMFPAGGAIPGAIGGAMLGTGADEAIKRVQGFYQKSPEELAGRLAQEGLQGLAFEGVPRGVSAIKKPLFDASSSVLSRFGGVTPESKEIAQSLQPYGVHGPVSSIAPGLKMFEYDRTLRNIIAKDPNQAPRIAAINQRAKEILEGFGLQGSELAHAVLEVGDRTTALSPQAAAEGVMGKMRAGEAASAAATEARKAGLTEEETRYKNLADQAIKSTYQGINRMAEVETPGSFGSNVARVYEHERDLFNRQMGAAYGAVHNMAGGAEVVPTSEFRHQALELVSTMDPQTVPPIIRRWAVTAQDGAPMKTTIEEAHNLRTALREMANIKDLSPIGQRGGNLSRMAASVDDAISQSYNSIGESAGAALREADDAYAQGIKKFTNAKVNSLIQDVRQGRMPDANEVANLLIDKDSVDATKQVWDVLPPQLQQEVFRTDLRRMIDAASIRGRDGLKTLKPEAMLKALDEREKFSFMYDKPFVSSMRELALQAGTLNGEIDVSALPPSNVREYLQKAVSARAALETEASTVGPKAMQALRSDDQGLVDAGAKYFMQKQNEARTLAGMQAAGGINSPEWKKVQQFAAKDLLKSAVAAAPKGLASTVRGESINEYLGNLTSVQQKALFGDRLEDIKLIAKQAKFLFPEHESEVGTSLAGAAIMGHMPSMKAARAYTLSRVLGAIADSPTLSKMLAGELRTNPYGGRGILSYLLQAGTDIGITQTEKRFNPRASPEQFSGTTGVVPRQPFTLPPAPPPSAVPGARPIQRGYGGPQE